MSEMQEQLQNKYTYFLQLCTSTALKSAEMPGDIAVIIKDKLVKVKIMIDKGEQPKKETKKKQVKSTK